MNTGYCYKTPLGPFSVLQTGDRIVSAGFQSLENQLKGHSLENFSEQRNSEMSKQLDTYFAGETTAFDHFEITQIGTELQEEIWQTLTTIPKGEVFSYKKLAAQTSKPKAVRAAASACGKNRVALFVPCHRAIRSDGTLGGYLYGLPIKKALLALEGLKV